MPVYLFKSLGGVCGKISLLRCTAASSLSGKNHSTRTSLKYSYIEQNEAKKIDQELITCYKYSLDQLMELSGLSCAVSIAECYPLKNLTSPCVLVCCGPGNNGGNGLVCARHLKMFGYFPVVFYPNRSEKLLHQNLTAQCQAMEIPFVDTLYKECIISGTYTLIVDAIFGKSFKPPPSIEFTNILCTLQKIKIPICSIDIPSGWNVDTGMLATPGIQPELLISLIIPKKCACTFKGKYHYLGGRVVPPKLTMEYNLTLPVYSGSSCCVRLN